MTHDSDRCSAPGVPLKPDQLIWVISSRSVPIQATCIRTKGAQVWVEYPDGRTSIVNIGETAPRAVEEVYWTPPVVDAWR